jgi:8-oxo-dGTP pyrophosphatase MutT (NUDIX family)
MRTLTLGAPVEGVDYEKRTAVRCLIINDSQICIIHVKKGMYDNRKFTSTTSNTPTTGNYYKLPGGGVESEDPNDTIACQREALEETGCEVDVRPELIAQVTEYRGTLHQESRVYICTVRKDTGKVELTDLEASEGLVHLWCPVAEALQKMRAAEPSSELGEFIKKRDMFLVEAYLQTCEMSSQM